MSMPRRDALKIVTAAPFLGLFSGATTAHAKTRAWKSRTEQCWRILESPNLGEVAFPLGGIGTGSVALGGRGQLRDWEICNHPSKNRTLANTCFALWYRQEGGEPRALILESQLNPPFPGWMGLSRDGMPGMPRFDRAKFYGAYPFARLELEDENIPVRANLETFNPFIPGNVKDSSLPVAVFYWQIENTSRKPMDISVQMSQLNICGDDEFGKNQNTYVAKDGLRGLRMTGNRHADDHHKFGTMALVTPHTDVTYLTRWARSGWFDDQSLFWNDFSEDGRLTEGQPSDPTKENQTDTGSLCLSAHLEPGESKTFPFLLAWHFPQRENYWNSEKEIKGKRLKNYYTNHFADAWAVADYTWKNLERLESETKQFHDALFDSTLPPEVLDAVSSQASILKSNTCFITDDGHFWGFEGTTDHGGCCPLNCTHVWNYEQTLAHLFPSLERSVRIIDFNTNTNEEGHMAFRTLIPVGLTRWNWKPAADGQMGTIVKLYREWQLSGDDDYLRSVWPGAKRALEYAWHDWDKDRDGVMEGEQHNTYDIEYFGPNPMMGAIYLAALEAGARMAEAMGDAEAAKNYRSIAANGRANLDSQCWNGEYYNQVFDKAKEVKYQLGDGCLSDQLLGQWMAHVNGLGYVLPQEHVKSSMYAVYKYNFKPVLSDHYNPQRIFALGDEGGLLLCSWPRGNRPPLPFVYSDEVWTGIEYQVAAHLIYEGYIQEGLDIVRAVRDRHDGQRRNPWDEIECGHHYARALASWSVLLALSGFRYSGPQLSIGFLPVIEEKDFQCFWSCDPGWGNYRQKLRNREIESELQMLHGCLKLGEIRIPKPKRLDADDIPDVDVCCGERVYTAEARVDGSQVCVRFNDPILLPAGETLHVEVSA